MAVGSDIRVALVKRDSLLGCRDAVDLLANQGCEVESIGADQDILQALNRRNPEVILFEAAAVDDVRACFQAVFRARNRAALLVMANSNLPELQEILQHGVDGLFLTDLMQPDALWPLVENSLSAHLALQKTLDDFHEDQRSGFLSQAQFLPVRKQNLNGLDCDFRLKPLFGLSGDAVMYRVLPDERVLFYLADVSGHGAAASLVTCAFGTLVTTLVEAGQFSGLSAAGILDALNRGLLRLGLDQHVTLFLGLVDVQCSKLEYSCAGHFPGAILSQRGQTSYLELGGLPLGICEGQYEDRHEQLDGRFYVVVVSDGILEVLPEGSLKEREAELLRLVTELNGDLDVLWEVLELHGDKDMRDDLSILTISGMG